MAGKNRGRENRNVNLILHFPIHLLLSSGLCIQSLGITAGNEPRFWCSLVDLQIRVKKERPVAPNQIIFCVVGEVQSTMEHRGRKVPAMPSGQPLSCGEQNVS